MNNLDEYNLTRLLSGARVLGKYQDDGRGGMQLKVTIFEEAPTGEEVEVMVKTITANLLSESASRRWFLEMLSGLLLDAYLQGRQTNRDNISHSLHVLMAHMGVR